MTTKKSLLAFAAAVSTAALLPLAALADPQGNLQGAGCGSGASAAFVNINDANSAFIGTNSALNTSIQGNGSQQRAGYELRITGLRSPIDGIGWQNCEVYYNAGNSNVSLANLYVNLQFNDGSTLASSFANIGTSPIKVGKWQVFGFTNRDFAGQGRTKLLTRLVVFQENNNTDLTQVTFGKVNVFHYNQGGLGRAGQIAFKDGGCSDLNQSGNGDQGASVTGNSAKEQFLNRRALRQR